MAKDRSFASKVSKAHGDSSAKHCPKCGENTLVIKTDREQNKVFAKCSCGFSKILPFYPAYEPVDYYNKITDDFYSNS